MKSIINEGVCTSLSSIPTLAGILNPTSFFSKFINLDKDKIQYLKDNLLVIFNETSLKILKQIDEDNCLKIIKYIEEYKDLFEISNNYLERILNIKEEILSKKEIIILNPSINNLLNGDIYIFK